MNRRDRIGLFFRVGGSFPAFLLVIAGMGGAFYYLGSELDIADRVFLALYAVGGLALAVYYWRKGRRGVLAATQGLRRTAEVTAIRFHSRGDDGDDSYLLVWKDSAGHVGKSLPAVQSSFDGIKTGDRIVIYRNHDPNDSWWERDVYGPAIRSKDQSRR
ncbi:MAG: hypothetical protein AAF718_16620 [Pseudomonadota bacterium]